jgi:hypothetical protein
MPICAERRRRGGGGAIRFAKMPICAEGAEIREKSG